jgi:hypothetical protein
VVGRRPRRADDPWGAHTLEWATSSPPPPCNFVHIPVVTGLYPTWERPVDAPVVTGLKVSHRQVLLTTLMDARPDSIHNHPGPTITPLLAAMAIGVTFIGGIFTPWAFVIGPALLLPPVLVWMLPHGKPPEERDWGEEPA